MADEISLLPKYLERDIVDITISQFPKMKWYEYERFDFTGAKLKLTLHYIGGMTTTAEFDVTSTDAPEQFLTTGQITFNLIVDNEPEDIHVEYPITVEVYERWATDIRVNTSLTKMGYRYEEEFHHSDVYLEGIPNIVDSPFIRITDFDSIPDEGGLITSSTISISYNTYIRDENFDLISRTYRVKYNVQVSNELTGMFVSELTFRPYEAIDWASAHCYEIYDNGDQVIEVPYNTWDICYPTTPITSPPTRIEQEYLCEPAYAVRGSFRWDGEAKGPRNKYSYRNSSGEVEDVWDTADVLPHWTYEEHYNAFEIDAPWVTRCDYRSTYESDQELQTLTLDSITRLSTGSFESSYLQTLNLAKCESINVSFQYLRNHLTINAPNLKSIGGAVFRYSSVVLKCPSLESIGVAAFQYGSVDVGVLPNLIELGRYAFYAANISSFEAPSLITVDNNAFESAHFVTNHTLNLPEVITVGDHAFSGTTDSTDSVNILLPKAEIIGRYAFSDRFRLELGTYSMDLPSCTDLGSWAFDGCDGLIEVTLPNLKVVDLGTFNNCSSLTSADLPKATSIGNYAFLGCNSLKEIIVGIETNMVCEVAEYSLPHTIESIWVKDELVDAYKSAPYWIDHTAAIKPISERIAE